MTPKNILIVCSHFWPSIGGLETSMAQLGAELLGAGHRVKVLTIALEQRKAEHYQGIGIASVEMDQFAGVIRATVASGNFDVCILVQDPLGQIIWSIEGVDVPASTRLLIQPIINEDGYSKWQDNADFRQRLTAILQGADAVVTMTRSGPDHRFLRAAGLAPVYLPNAAAVLPPAGDFRQQFGIDPDSFLILHVANLYAVKNHVGLIDTLDAMPASWKLVMIGTQTHDHPCVEAVNARLAARPEICYIPGLPPEWIAAAMQAADVVVLASHGEGSPITLLEAMAHGKPWLATPHCGAANDHLGGFICELDGFMPRLQQLAAHPDWRQALGAISHAHWQQCYAWPMVRQGWLDLIEAGRLQRSFQPSPQLAARMGVQIAAMQVALRQMPAVTVWPGRGGVAQAARLVAGLGPDFAVQVGVPGQPDPATQFSIDLGADIRGLDPRRVMRLAERTPAQQWDAAASYVTAWPEVLAAGQAAGADIALASCGADFAHYHVRAYRSGPIRFGWIGNVSSRQLEAMELLVPAMRDRHSLVIFEPGQTPAATADFLQSIDVLLLTSNESATLEQAMAAMASGVYLLGVRGGLLAELLTETAAGILADATGAALHEAMNWCVEHADQVRRDGYRQAQLLALRPEIPLWSVWRQRLQHGLALAGLAPGRARPRILIIADVRGWIFERHARFLQAQLKDAYDIEVDYLGCAVDDDAWDLLYPLEWNLAAPAQIRNPAKWITGIRSHLSWEGHGWAVMQEKLRAFSMVHVVSERLYGLLAGVHPQLRVLSHGIILEHFSTAAKLGEQAGSVRVGWAGNSNVVAKGFQQFIAPLGQLPGVELKFNGYANTLLDINAMRPFYESIDVYVCCSITEGNNNSLMEAASMGRAIVTTDVGTVPEYLVDGVSALIVPREEGAILAAVERLRDDPALRLRLGAAAREAVQGFSWHLKLLEHRRFFDQALHRAGHALDCI